MLNVEHKNTSIRELKSFALTMSWAVPCLFMFILPWLFERNISWWPLIFSGLLMLIYFSFPKGILPIYRLWMAIASVIGWINTRIILALVFYVIILPTGVLLKIFGKLQYNSFEKISEKSFWKTGDVKLKKEDLERPF